MKLISKSYKYEKTNNFSLNSKLLILCKNKTQDLKHVDSMICLKTSLLKSIFKKSIFNNINNFLLGKIYLFTYKDLFNVLKPNFRYYLFKNFFFVIKYKKNFYSSRQLKKIVFFSYRKNIWTFLNVLKFYTFKRSLAHFFFFSK